MKEHIELFYTLQELSDFILKIQDTRGAWRLISVDVKYGGGKVPVYVVMYEG